MPRTKHAKGDVGSVAADRKVASRARGAITGARLCRRARKTCIPYGRAAPYNDGV